MEALIEPQFPKPEPSVILKAPNCPSGSGQLGGNAARGQARPATCLLRRADHGRPWQTISTSFGLQVHRLDNRPPLFNFALLEGSESCRRLLIECGNLLTQVGNRRCTAWSANASRTAALSLEMTSCGVPLGAHMPDQTVM